MIFLTKDELIKILDSIGIPVSEGINKDKNTNQFPRIVFWELFWDFSQASSKDYSTIVTYQISFFSKKPRDSKLIELIKTLHERNIFVNVSHEYVQNEKYFHSYFSLDVLEAILE